MTIAENIAIGNQNKVTENQIHEAAKRAFAHDFIAELPEGYATACGEKGAGLSGGQKQRIAIARALCRNAPVLVFDEATSALDAESERGIMETIETLRSDHTILITTHNLKTITSADLIVVMADGHIAESGTHADENYDCKVDYILPFEGKWTVFNGGIGRGMSHSWGILPQRYAYDFIIMDDEGKSLSGDSKRLQSYYCYGKNIIAHADGIVVKVSGKHKDSRVNGEKVYCDAWDIRGNFIVMKHAEKEFSVFAHLAPGSITVRKGDKVKQGEVIGKCGNSGNTSELHLHYQLQTGKSFFFSAGLPISFVSINSHEKTNYGMADPRGAQKEVLKAHCEGGKSQKATIKRRTKA